MFFSPLFPRPPTAVAIKYVVVKEHSRTGIGARAFFNALDVYIGRPQSVDQTFDLSPHTHIGETVVLLYKGYISSDTVRVWFFLEDMNMSRFQQGPTYEQIWERMSEKHGLHVSHLNIAPVKRKSGIIEWENYNK